MGRKKGKRQAKVNKHNQANGPLANGPLSNGPLSNGPKESALAGFIGAAGTILAVSYPVLALSTGTRAAVRLLRGETTYLPDGLSALAAVFYLIATIGFAYRRPWSWRLSVGILGLETACTLLVGSLSFIYPELIGRTAWRHFGADYGYFPLVQPLLGLAWLFHPQTLQAYGVQPRWLLFFHRHKQASS